MEFGDGSVAEPPQPVEAVGLAGVIRHNAFPLILCARREIEQWVAAPGQTVSSGADRPATG